MSNPTPHRAKQTSDGPALTSFSGKRRGPLITGFPVVLDACVLVNSTIRDFVLYAAHLALYRPIWSADILRELRATLSRFGIQADRVEYIVSQMSGAFPEACVDGYETLIGGMKNDPGDRHVLACAVVGKAQLIVTENLRHFPPTSLEPYHIEATNADDFLRDLLDIDRDRMLEVLTTIAETRKMPPRTIEELLEAVRANGCPGFAADMRAALERCYSDS